MNDDRGQWPNATAPQTLRILSDLWGRRLDTLVSGIANSDPYYQQIANAAEHISAEYQGRFLVELIQNANDQAVRAHLTDSIVTIIRTERLVAVGNSGQPFDPSKVDAITSIFKSDKTADECLGNKGIGFKAVFQVADSAEVFSSASNSNLAEGCPIAFRMVRRPFDDPEFMAMMRGLTADLLNRDAYRREKIENRFPGEPAVDAVIREATRAAWFTFPLASRESHLRARIAELGLPEELLSTTQTIIVLPLDGAEHTPDRVSKAIDDVEGGDGQATDLPPAASLLFLPGIRKIDVVDHVRGFRAVLAKTDLHPKEDLGSGVFLRRQRTTCTHIALADPNDRQTPKSREWWVAERIVGGRDHGDKARATRERQAIREAIQALRLPEENWKDVEQVPVAIALPDPAKGEDEEITPLGAGGRFCIGLPTQVRTGLPLWVSAHFHGKIDRTAIDFENDYNDLLFDATLDLAHAMFERLKRQPSKATHRLIALAMERGAGELADAFYAEGGLARTDVVVCENGAFILAADLKLPKASDLKMFWQTVKGVTDLAVYGFRLPDLLLLTGARGVLDGLAEDTEAEDALYLTRPQGLPSLLEHAARHHRKDGPAFWEEFLTWVLGRFIPQQSEALNAQAILPTGNDDLASPSSRVFFPPMRLVAHAAEDNEKPQAIDDAGDELATIDESVAPLLKFFDESAMKLRTGTAREYTPLAQKLAPTGGGGLVRRPRQADLINDALIPALKDCTDDNDRALSLLRQALVWLVGMPTKSKQRVSIDELLIPVRGPSDTWQWIEPGNAYLGEGWDTDPNIDLITRAFGGRVGSQLVPWERFERKAIQIFREADKAWWLQRMKEIGVWDCPRVVRGGKRVAVVKANSYSHLTVLNWARCPTPCVEGMWNEYLAHISQRTARTKSGYEFYVEDVTWIDGLEHEDIRPLVVEAMLRRPDRYQSYESTTLARWGGEESSDVPSLWVHAVRHGNWPVIPVSGGLRTATEAWFLPLESRSSKADRFAFLPCVKTEFSGARRLLHKLGVVTLEEAPIPRLVMALHELARRVEGAEPEALRHIEALAADLYEAVQTRLKAGDPSEGLKQMLDAPVPLLRDKQIGCANLKELDRVLIDDDALRRRYIRGFDHSWGIPKRFHQTYNELVAGLRELLGMDKVIRVSECVIDVQFHPFEDGPLLLEYIRQTYPSRSLAEDIGLLIVKGGTRATSPHEDTFRQAWGRIARTRVSRGTFEGTPPPRACFDAQRAGGPTLMVDSKLASHEVIGEMWQLVGPAYRDIWASYVQSLKDNQVDQFFEDRGVYPAERTEVEAAIGLGFEQRLRKYQPVCLALWRRDNPGWPSDEFHAEWAKNARTAETASAWLKWIDLTAQVEMATREDEPQASLSLLHALGLSMGQWQNARRDLGVPSCRLKASIQMYEAGRAAIAGHVMAWFAYLVVPRASGSSGPTVPPGIAGAVHQWVDKIRQLPVPDEVAEDHSPANCIISRAAQDAAQVVAGIPDLKDARALIEPLAEVAKSAPTEIASINLKDEPDKAATVYECDDEVSRGQQAMAAVDSVLKVATALTAKRNETLDAAAVREQPLVALLSQGTWANRVSVLAAVRYAIEQAAPATAARMKDRQAFRDLDDWRTLWQKFDELGEIPKPAVPPPPKPKFEVLGSGWTQEEFDNSASAGPTGELAQLLQEAVNPNLDVATLRGTEREEVHARARKTGGGGSGAGTRKRVPKEYLKMLGAVGEHFVYQQIKAVCPDFDATNWRSEGKALFGYGVGDDSLGYDFEYQDVGGKLTGKPGVPRCLLEIKSTARECGDFFEMSTHEWEVAQQCHDGRTDAIYVIVRVAGVASKPEIVDLLVDPVDMHLRGLLDYSSRDLLVAVGKPAKKE